MTWSRRVSVREFCKMMTEMKADRNIARGSRGKTLYQMALYSLLCVVSAPLHSQRGPLPTEGDTTVVYLGHLHSQTSGDAIFADLRRQVSFSCTIDYKDVGKRNPDGSFGVDITGTCSAPFVYRLETALPLAPGSEYPATILHRKDGFYFLELRYGPVHPSFQLYTDWPNCNLALSTKAAGPVHWDISGSLLDCAAGEQDTAHWVPAKAWDKLSTREQFDFYLNSWNEATNITDWDQRQQYIDTDLHGIIATSLKLTPSPEIPEKARKSFVEGATYLKNGDAYNAQDKFGDAVYFAPWWGDAHYNYAIALEKYHSYDKAVNELKTYLLFNPPEADAREAQDRIYAIGVEKEGGEKEAQEYHQQQLAKYVVAGAQRLCGDQNFNRINTPSAWEAKNGSLGIVGTYVYSAGDGCLGNVFRMPNGHYVAVALSADPSSDGGYAGDEVFLADLTESGAVRVKMFPFGSLDGSFDPAGGGSYKVSISDRSSTGIVSVIDRSSGAGFTLPLSDLYASRYRTAFDHVQIGGATFKLGYSYGTGTNSYYALFFDPKLDAGCFGPCPLPTDGLRLTPTYVVSLGHGDQPISNTGYFIRYHGTTWEVEK